jgi:hypothetical protein
VLRQLESLGEQAKLLATELSEVALERDVLAQERDAAKAALAKARTRSSYAVLPHKGPNGTWRRPIILECRNGQVTLQPNGPSFSLLDLSLLLGPGSSPIVGAVAREAMKAQAMATPDGAPVVPYIFFVIRPDGIKPYYNARGQLEPLGISFGYELVDQNMEIDYPDLDNLDDWDGSGMPRPAQPSVGGSLAGSSGDRPWPAPSAAAAGGQGTSDPSNTFVWPARPGLAAGGMGPGAGDATTAGSGGGGSRDFPRGGRPALGSVEPSAATRPYASARDGLGRGGSGVDPVPLGTPLNDPNNLYEGAGPGGTPAGGARRGGPPAFDGSGRTPGLMPGSPAGVEVAGDASSSSPPPAQPQAQPGSAPRLIPVSPEGMPGLENPNASGRGAGRSPGDPSRGGWIVSSRDRSPLPETVTENRPAPSGSSDLAPDQGNLPAAAGSANGSSAASGSSGASAPPRTVPPGQAGSGSYTPNQGAPPPLSHLARLAGAVPEAGAAGQPSKLASSSPFGVPLPLGNSQGDGADSGDDADSANRNAKSGSSPPGPRSHADRRKPLSIDVPFEMVVACAADGVVIHPGGYRLSAKALKGQDALLLKHLKTIVQTRRQVDPLIHPVPSIRFLVEPGGSETYHDARRQTVLSGVDWPVSLQVADSDILENVVPRESL